MDQRDQLTYEQKVDRLYDAILEPELGMKDVLLSLREEVVGNGGKVGLKRRVEDIEQLHEEEALQHDRREKRIYAIASAVAAVVAIVLRELMRHFGV